MTSRENINSFLFTLFGFRKTKNTSHLVLIVFIHIAAWCLFFALPLMFLPLRVSNSRFLYIEVFSKFLPVAFFYFNYYFLLPKFFERKRYLGYFLLVLGCILLISLQEVILRREMPGRSVRFFQASNRDRLMYRPAREFVLVRNTAEPDTSFMPPIPTQLFKENRYFGMPSGIFLVSVSRSISISLILLLIGGFIRLGYSFIRNQNEKKAMENAHLNAEVNFLKSQINPHFLFNTLNSIYSQAHNKSEHTEYSILKLSELLRYVLYESGERKVPLEKDILYLKNYIDLQRMRLSSKVVINYNVTGQLEGNSIAPLLLISFIENAFKHGISYSKASVINIELMIFEKTLTLLVSNPIVENNSFATGGVGLKNVARRLELLYAGNYLLDIVHNDHLHIVNLKINLNSD